MVNKKLECFIMSQFISAHIRIISNFYHFVSTLLTDGHTNIPNVKQGDAGFKAAAKFVYIFFSHFNSNLLNYDQMMEKTICRAVVHFGSIFYSWSHRPIKPSDRMLHPHTVQIAFSWNFLHNSFSESRAKTTRTACANKQHLLNSPQSRWSCSSDKTASVTHMDKRVCLCFTALWNTGLHTHTVTLYLPTPPALATFPDGGCKMDGAERPIIYKAAASL